VHRKVFYLGSEKGDEEGSFCWSSACLVIKADWNELHVRGARCSRCSKNYKRGPGDGKGNRMTACLEVETWHYHHRDIGKRGGGQAVTPFGGALEANINNSGKVPYERRRGFSKIRYARDYRVRAD